MAITSRVRRARGFTLIELLVVVGIVAVLAGMLMPVLKTVRTQASCIQCRGNLRICTMAMLAYTDDWEGLLPYADSMGSYAYGGPWWPHRTSPYLDDSYRKTLYAGNNIYHCPLAQREVPSQWKYNDRFAFHFGMNTSLYAVWDQGASVWKAGIRPVPLSTTRSQAVVLADGHVDVYTTMLYMYDYFNINATAGPSGVALPWPIEGSFERAFAATPPPLTPLRITMHGGSISRAHLDGHVSALTGMFDRTVQTNEFAGK
jgi:prepilin-type N-terminal cleavage/methylation domain-containing protein